MNAPRALVRGQLLSGVSVLELATERGSIIQIVVPGNVGDAETLADCVRAVACSPLTDCPSPYLD